MESFPEAIDAVALKAPGRLAMVVTTDGSSLTYERLATCSVFVARGLLALGVSSKQPLLSHMRRGCEWYILYVALSRLGVPLAAMPGQGHDQSHELRDLRWTQLLALKPQLLVVDGDALPVEVDLPRHRFDDVLDMGAPLNQELPDVCADDVLCYCFTGGTTGRQRCVPVTQRMALHELRHYEVALHWTGDAGNEDDCARVLQASSLYWASAVFGQLDLALALQGCAVVSEDIDVKDLAHTVREQRVNILGLPPSMLGLMDPLDFIDMRSQGGYCHVRRLISWGEPCPEAIAYTWGASRWPWRFLDILISTEYWLSFVASERDAEGRSRFTPVKDLEVYLHPLGRTAEDEDFSELCLRGPGVCERLHSADGLDLTEAFLEHQGQRFYRSGDLAKWSGQDIVFRGRGDQLVKVFGKWVDLSDLSRRLSNLPGVLEAATITGGPDEHHAVAVLDKRSNPDSFAAAYRILPSGGGVQLHWFSEPLPRKAETQKVDRARLLSQLRGMAGMASAPVTPLPRRKGDTRQEDALLASVVEVLGNTSCSSLQSSFLACGGDSVTALRCAAAARQRGLEISALALLSARTLAEAAKAEESEPLQKRPRLAPESGSFTRTQPFALTAEELQEEISFQLGLPSRAVDCSWPCTAFQELLLNALEASEADAVRESPGTLQSCALLRPTVPAVSLQGLRNAWLLVQQRCTALRSRFIRVRGRHFQVALRTNWSKEDLRVTQSSSGSLKRQLRALMKEDLKQHFHTTGPLCRLHLLRAKAESSDKLALLLSIHNSVSDGWSTNLLLQDLLSLAVGIAAPLQRPGQALDNIHLEVDRPSWWRRTLEGFRPTALQRQVHLHSFNLRRLAVRWEALRQRAKAWQLTPAALVLAAWSLVWSRATGSKDFLLGAVLSGREAVPSDLLGCTASLVPLRLRVTDSWQSLHSFSTEVQRCLIAHASMWPCPSLTEIRSWCGLPPGPMFDCAWIFDHTPPLPRHLCMRTGFELVCEHEVPAAGQEADTPELRVSRHDQEITGRKRKSVRGCIVDSQLSVLNLVIVKKGENDIPGLTDKTVPRRLGPKRASKIKKMFNLSKEDDVRQYVIRRPLPVKEGKKPKTKAPKIQRLVTPRVLRRRRKLVAIKKMRIKKAKEAHAEYTKLLAKKAKEAKEKRHEMIKRRRISSSQRESVSSAK